MFWIHGGAFMAGDDRTDPKNTVWYANKFMNLPVVHVGANYRLNGFGFLASSQVARKGQLNLGLKDQRLALKWVKKYISYFGGDPNKITIYGESAGAISVGLHLLAYGGENEKDLFRGAIMESGSPTTVNVPKPYHFQGVYDDLVRRANCASSTDSLECLKRVPFDKIAPLINAAAPPVSAIAHFPFGPVVDGSLIPDFPYRLIDQGKMLRMPMIAGDNLDEGTGFVAGKPWNTDSDLRNIIKRDFANITSSSLDNIMALYPNDPALGSPYNTGTKSFYPPQGKRAASAYGDLAFVAPRRLLIDRYAALGTKVWSYRFEYNFDPASASKPNWPGIAHSFELPAVFGLIDGIASRAMLPYWVSFTHGLDPNTKSSINQVQWNSYDSTSLNQIRFEQTQVVMRKDDFRKKQTDFINSIRGQLYG
eukprot:TRINITY_DN4168_c0_g1_i1.p1 TRINITY_DN4168_c0_g1~~TRINITY_DN4168_c0_g1_i1.p1  ORF type:complete len:422 (-),score=138.52 TRINITY_DN4168_c0_g1_i1:63-1328(-)